jgi:hypothetical protein
LIPKTGAAIPVARLPSTNEMLWRSLRHDLPIEIFSAQINLSQSISLISGGNDA